MMQMICPLQGHLKEGPYFGRESKIEGERISEYSNGKISLLHYFLKRKVGSLS